ncbi:MAG: ABC transporter ATP-binding protein/permease [Anaerolineae bacterium]|nr:ABC transporter ATP-binding protein/permease [Anaerolineae bacterium]
MERGNPGSLRRAIGYLSKQRRTTLLAYGALVIATIAQLAVPNLVQNMINAITQGFAAKQILQLPAFAQGAAAQLAGTTVENAQSAYSNAESLLINAVAIIVVFAVLRAVFAFIQTYMAENTSQGAAFHMRNDIFSKIQRLSFSYYDRTQTGQLMIRATDDVEKVRLFIAQGLIMTVQAFLLLVVTLIILLATNWRLTLAILPILPIALVVFTIFGKVSQPLFIEVQKRLSVLNTILQENVAGIKVVKAFVREKQEQQRFANANAELFDQQMRIARIFSVLFPLIFVLANLGQVVILYFAGQQIIPGDIGLGEYQSFTLYLMYVFFPLGQLGFIISLMAQAAASATRIFEILDAESDVKNKPGAIDLPAIQGAVEFKDVTFRYFSSGDNVLNQVSFKAEPGQTIALLGATGSGKTTIINLIPRFYDATEGTVLIDGHDIRDVTLDSLRSQIGIVLQETNLFSGSIRDNIAYGRPDATLEQVVAAAKAAAADDFVSEFPEGYDTPVGERGSTLSGGQKQRIAIARALLLNPKLLILDDSTSAVDFTTERRIQQALDNLMQGRTSFVIAQRISTVQAADQIIVLDKGKLVAMGTHGQLMETSPIYAEIYNSQLVEDAPAEAVSEEA